MKKKSYVIELEYIDNKIFGRFWSWRVKDAVTDEIVLSDSTAGDCSKDVAQAVMKRQLFNVLGIRLA